MNLEVFIELFLIGLLMYLKILKLIEFNVNFFYSVI